jgi:hypothetical protein
VNNSDHAAFGDYAPNALDAASASITMTNEAESQDRCQGAAPKLLISVG